MAASQTFKKLGIGLGITIILTLFVHTGISLFLKRPFIEDLCSKNVASEEAGPNFKYEQFDNFQTRDNRTIFIKRGEECVETFRMRSVSFQQNGFIVALLSFVIAMVLGVIVRKSKTISGGLVGGSLVVLLSGIIRFYAGIDQYARFAMLGVALIALLFLGWRKVQDMEEQAERKVNKKA